MIRYPISLSEIHKTIDDDPKTKTWRRRARRRTMGFIQRGCYDEKEGKGIWSEVKPHYLKIQHYKCAYCERQLEVGEDAPIEYDLDHFRPKRNVRVWPEEQGKYTFSTGSMLPGGYYRLVYHPGNYTVACKICNTLLKSDFFPIAGNRIVDRDHPDEYIDEKPFLLYPLGPGEDPEEIIHFVGVKAVPKYDNPDDPRHRKARVMIDFFDLNREGLELSRARVVVAVWLAFRSRNRNYLDLFTRPGAPHTSCAKCFRALCEADRIEALRRAKGAEEIIDRLTR